MSAQDDILAMDIEQADKVKACLKEILPGCVDTAPGMGFNGVWYEAPDTDDVEWYFDSTWGGDDGFHEGKMVAFVTITYGRTVDCHDRVEADAPYIWDDPLTIAKWIVGQIEKGIPDPN
jgi:hypothetical protein